MDNPIEVTQRFDAIYGCLLGMAVGDAIGLPYEGLSARRTQRLIGTNRLQHRFLFGRGMVSDDTEHACMTATSLWDAQGSMERFSLVLARRMRWWLLGCPAGIGRATLRAGLKLWFGYSPSRSGVSSAGNGPAMRAPMIGVLYAEDLGEVKTLVRASTQLTHVDHRAEEASLAVAVAAAHATRNQHESISATCVIAELREYASDENFLELLDKIEDHLEQQSSAKQFANALGLANGVTGYIYHTVPVALFCWLRYEDSYEKAVTEAIRLGGDTDTVAAIVGALVAISSGVTNIPDDWLSGIIDWSYCPARLEELATGLNRAFANENSGNTPRPSGQFLLLRVVRNLLFATTVLCHGFGRLLPPY